MIASSFTSTAPHRYDGDKQASESKTFRGGGAELMQVAVYSCWFHHQPLDGSIRAAGDGGPWFHLLRSRPGWCRQINADDKPAGIAQGKY